MRTILSRAALAAAALAWAAVAGAQTPPAPEGTVDDIPSHGELTVITSQKLTYDAQKQYALFEEDVVVSDPSLKLKCDKMVVHFDAENRIKSIVAEGHVVMSQSDKTAWAGRATYDLATGCIVLEESPRVMRGRDMLLGERITFYRDENRIKVEKSRMIIYPDEGGARDVMKGGR